MPGLLAYAAAGAAAGIGDGIVERARQLREEAMLKLKRQWDQEDAQQQHDWRMEEIGLRDSLKGGGGRRRSGGGGSSSEGGLPAGESIYSGSSSGLMPSGSGGAAAPKRDPMAMEEQGTSNPDEFSTYGYDEPAADGAAAAPADAGARVPDVSKTPSKLTGEKEIDGYLYGRAGNRWYPYIGPDGGPVKAEDLTKDGEEKGERPPFLTKQDQEAPTLKKPEVERYAPERERQKPDTEKPQTGLLPRQGKPPAEDTLGVPKDEPPSRLPKGKPKELSASARKRLEMSFRDASGRNLDLGTFSQIVSEVESLMGEGKTEAEATQDVMARLEREPRVTNKAGTAVSRMLPGFLGGTPADAPPDETAPDPEGKVKGIRPRDDAGGLKAPPADILAAARAAIAKGKSRAAVIARLKENGYSAEGI